MTKPEKRSYDIVSTDVPLGAILAGADREAAEMFDAHVGPDSAISVQPEPLGESGEETAALPAAPAASLNASPAGETTEAQIFAAVQAVLQQIDTQSIPVIRGSEIRRARLEQDIVELDGKIANLDAQRQLVMHAVESAMATIANERQDLVLQRMMAQGGVNAVTQKPTA